MEQTKHTPTLVAQWTEIGTGYVRRTLSDGTEQRGSFGEWRHYEDPNRFYVVKEWKGEHEPTKATGQQ
jgi:hypothetical protein